MQLFPVERKLKFDIVETICWKNDLDLFKHNKTNHESDGRRLWLRKKFKQGKDMHLIILSKLFYLLNNCSAFKSDVLLQVNVLSTSLGKVVCGMRVEEEHTNKGGTLHGGLTATLVDVISTLAIMNSERGAPGVSVDMNIT